MFLTPEPYLYEIQDFWARKCLALIRCSSHPLNIEVGRHTGVLKEDRICKLCAKHDLGNIIEDEFHFICNCPMYTDIRSQLLPSYNLNTREEFIYLMMTENIDVLKDLTTFVKLALKRRQYLQSSEL